MLHSPAPPFPVAYAHYFDTVLLLHATLLMTVGPSACPPMTFPLPPFYITTLLDNVYWWRDLLEDTPLSEFF